MLPEVGVGNQTGSSAGVFLTAVLNYSRHTPDHQSYFDAIHKIAKHLIWSVEIGK